MGVPGQKSSMSGFMSRGRSMGMTKKIGDDEKGVEALSKSGKDGKKAVKAMGYTEDQSGAILRGGAHIKPIMRMASGPAAYGSSPGMEKGVPRYKNSPLPRMGGGAYENPGGVRFGDPDRDNMNENMQERDRSADASDNNVLGTKSNVGDKKASDYYPGVGDIGLNESVEQETTNLLTKNPVAQEMTPRGVSIRNYEAGKNRADAGRMSKPSKAGYGKGQSHDEAGTSMSDYRAAKKASRKEVRAGKKEMRKANKRSVTYDGDGGKTVVNNRKRNLKDVNSGTKVGNALRGLFGKGNR